MDYEGYTEFELRQIGRYRIAGELGFGAMGTVYRALDPTIGRTVAIKAIRLTDFVDPLEREKVRERLLQEARVAGLLSHPSITTVFDVLEEEGSAFIVMEYVQGSSLLDLMRNGQLPEPPQLLQYLEQVADALDYAHRKGVVHRDIKLENILISHGAGLPDTAKISDFGISKFISQNTTHSGTMIGTPSYMAPEQIEGLPLDGRSDQYSLAVTVYELLTGTKPFSAERLATLFYQICKEDPPPPHSLNKTLNPRVGEVLARALAKEPDGRFPSCVEFVQSLTDALGQSGDWRPAAITTHETMPLASVAAAAGSASPNTVAKPPAVEDQEDSVEGAAVALAVPVATPGSLAQTELPLFSHRSRNALDGWADDSPPTAWRVPAILIGVLLIVIAALFLLPGKNARSKGPSKDVTQPATVKRDANASKATPSRQSNTAELEKESKTTPAEQSAPQPPRESAARSTALIEISILSEPSGAQVTFDDHPSYSCQTPCTFNLPAGRHTLTAQLSGYDTGRRIFNLPDDRQLVVNLSQSMGVLLVTTEPSGSAVIVDGKESGTTPLTLRLPIGSHQLAVVNGRGRHEELVLIQNDQFTSRSFRWQ